MNSDCVSCFWEVYDGARGEVAWGRTVYTVILRFSLLFVCGVCMFKEVKTLWNQLFTSNIGSGDQA